MTRTNPFKSLVESRKVPRTLESPEMGEGEGHSFENDPVVPSKYTDETTKIGAGLVRTRRLAVVVGLRHSIGLCLFAITFGCSHTALDFPSDTIISVLSRTLVVGLDRWVFGGTLYNPVNPIRRPAMGETQRLTEVRQPLHNSIFCLHYR